MLPSLTATVRPGRDRALGFCAAWKKTFDLKEPSTSKSILAQKIVIAPQNRKFVLKNIKTSLKT